MMTVELFLDQYKKAVVREQNLRDEIKRLDDRIGPPNMRMDGLPTKREPQHVTEDMALKLIELKMNYEEQIVDSLIICKTVVDMINSIPDPRCSRLLYLHYCADLSWEMVALDLHYSPDYVQKELHHKALKMLGDELNV